MYFMYSTGEKYHSERQRMRTPICPLAPASIGLGALPEHRLGVLLCLDSFILAGEGREVRSVKPCPTIGLDTGDF